MNKKCNINFLATPDSLQIERPEKKLVSKTKTPQKKKRTYRKKQ
jgi:hypothetical protein